MRRAYLDGLEADGTISFQAGAEDGIPAEAEGGPRRRTADTGDDVIDLAAMRKDLEAKRGGAK